MDRALDISNINIKRAYGLWTLLILLKWLRGFGHY